MFDSHPKIDHSIVCVVYGATVNEISVHIPEIIAPHNHVFFHVNLHIQCAITELRNPL